MPRIVVLILPATLLQTAILLIQCLASSAYASAPPPVIRATQSANCRFLVLVDFRLALPSAAGGQVVLSTNFQVLAPAFLPPTQQVRAQITLRSTPPWSLTLPHGGDLWPMISNDGSTLLLLHVQPATAHQVAFDIYRRNHPDGTFVCSINIDELWTPHTSSNHPVSAS